MQNTELNLVYKWVKVALIMLCIVLGVGAIWGLKSLGNVAPAYNSITVLGEGEAIAIPDVATFSFSVSADASTVASAQDMVTKKIDAITQALKDLGIEERDIKTSDYSAYPKYVYSQVYCIQAPCPGQTKQDGYTVSHTIGVKVRKTELSGQAVQVAGDKGASNISGVNFTVDDSEKLANEARAKAIANAKERAEVLARELKVRLVRVVSYSEGSGGNVMYMMAGKAMGMGGDAESRPAPTLPVGESKIKLSVNVTYEIR